MQDAIKLYFLYLQDGKSNLESIKAVSKELRIKKNDLYREILKRRT